MVPVNHAGDTVETETVKMVFLHPELAVGQQETDHFIFPIIKTPRAPCRMVSLRAMVEVQVVPSVEKAEAFRLIVHTV